MDNPGDFGLEDHPRSRGVYTGGDGFEWGVDGSSPLARGLRLRNSIIPSPLGIIPARAGFTCGSRSSWTRPADHPRSRGVYLDVVGGVRDRVGSSPLARGLQAWTHTHYSRSRIIPARAGFTRRADTTPWSTRDHPRSRGVYPGVGERVQGAEGSSPLARGLRPRHPGSGQRPGIIPARAGFTSSSP